MIKVLQLCLRVVYPPREGGSMAMAALAEGLMQNGCEITQFALNTTKHFVEQPETKTPDGIVLKTVSVDNRIRPLAALTNLLGGESFHIARFFSEEADKRLIEVLHGDWIVHFC